MTAKCCHKQDYYSKQLRALARINYYHKLINIFAWKG